MSSGAAAQELRLSIAGAGHTPDHRVNLGALTLHFFRVQALERAYEHIAHLAAGRGAAAGLVRVHALIGELERVGGIGRLEWQVHGAGRAVDLEALTALVKRRLRGGDDGVGPGGGRVDQRAELVAADPVDGRSAGGSRRSALSASACALDSGLCK